MIAKYLWLTGSVIIAALAGLHLYYTFFSDKFSSRNRSTIEAMQSSSPNISKQLTMWKAWIGFNASHSVGGLFIGVINFYIANQYFTILASDHFFFLFNITTIAFYVWVAKKYWFKTPLAGLAITLACYVLAYILTLLNK